MRKRLTQSVLKELLDYNPETGVLTWRVRDRRFFTSDRIWKSWNRKHAGKPALASRDTHGHLHGHILGKLRSAHRVIFLWMTGHWPLGVIDHIDHCRFNNAWENLRDISAEENARNHSQNKNNSSGCTGVYYQHDAGYVAALAGRYLGAFGEEFDEAVAVRQAAAAAAGFSDTHGAPRHAA